MLPTRESLPPETAVFMGFVRLCSEIKRQLAKMENKVVLGTINSSDVLDGLWGDNALPKWRALIGQMETNVRSPQMRRLARVILEEPQLNMGTDLDAYFVDAQALVDAIRAHPVLFKPDGTENDTIRDESGRRRATVYAAGELDDLLPLIRAALDHFA